VGAKQIHDAYGKKVLKEALGDRYDAKPATVPFGDGCGTLRIDGTVDSDIAVEIESRASKQVRGAIVDIICHPYPKKLVVLIKKYGNNYTEKQCKELLRRFAPNCSSEVVTLEGTGSSESLTQDKRIIEEAVSRLTDAQQSPAHLQTGPRRRGPV
jgi:hypothetical protein